mgnify:CR=1 FL=1
MLEIIGILAFVLAIIGGFKLMEYGMTYLDDYFEDFDNLLPFISFLVIFLGILILINMLGKVVKKMIDLTLLGGVDNFAGAIIGIAKWAIGLSIVLWLTHHYGIELPGQNEDLVLYPFLTDLAPNVIESAGGILPFAEELFDSIKDLISPI